MAAGASARSDKHSTIAFTLPISCQICLGKVKQPVLCSNNHVFCSPCMDVWLLRSKHCPACRTPINPSNPVKQIKGGLNQCQDDKDKITNPDLRKARFELLYKEYEDEFEKLQSEATLLKTENDILKTRLSKTPDLDFKHPSTADSNKLLMLTKKLQDAQKLYNKMKDEMSRVKQENNKLKDENVNLNRENEKLRIEISNRSPHRYGRYTVATLESKLETYEKEVRQLNKALERSDQYIENLEKDLESFKQKNPDDKYSVSSKSSSDCTKFSSDSRDSQADYRHDVSSEYRLHADGHTKRQLFGGKQENKLKSLDDDIVQNGDSFARHSDHATRKPSDSYTSQVSNSKHLASFYPGSLTKSLSDKQKASLDLEVSGSGQPMKMETVLNKNEFSERKSKSLSASFSKGSPKKVSFDLPKKDSSAASFDLDQPSPVTASFLDKAGSDYSYSTRQQNSKFDVSHATESKSKQDDDSKKNKPILKLKYTNGSSEMNNSNLTELDFNTTPQKHRSRYPDLMDVGLDDTQTIQSELDDLNISLTPELSDCMKLLNRAEKNVHSHGSTTMASSVVDSRLTGTLTIPSDDLTPSSSLVAHNSVSSADYFSLDSALQHKSNVDPLYSSSKSQSSGYSSSTRNVQPHNAYLGDSLKGWQHEYYRKVEANPYGDAGHTLYGAVDRSKYPTDLASSYPGLTVSKESLLGSVSKQPNHVESQSSVSSLDEELHQLGIANKLKKRNQNVSSTNSGGWFDSVNDVLGLKHSSFGSSSSKVNSKSYLNQDPLKSSYLYGIGGNDLSSDNKSSKRYSSLTDIPAATCSSYSSDLLTRSIPQTSSHTDLSNASIRKYSSLTNLPTGSALPPTFLAHSVSSLSSSHTLPTDHIPTLSGLHSHQQNSAHSSSSSQSKALPLSNQLNALSFLSSQSRSTSYMPQSFNHNFSLSSTGAAATIPSSLPSSFAASSSLRSTQTSSSDILLSYPPALSSSAGASSFVSSLSYGNPTSSGYMDAKTSGYGSSSSGYLSNRDGELDKVPNVLSAIQDLDRKGNYSYVSNASNDLSSRNSDSFLLPEPKKRLFDSSDDFDLTMSPIKATRVL